LRIFIDKTGLVAAVVAGLCALFMIFSTAAAAEKPVRSPEVTHTGKAPTGYTVTFRYANPTAKTVKIKGEWYFARPSELPQIAATPDHPIIEGQALLPQDSLCRAALSRVEIGDGPGVFRTLNGGGMLTNSFIIKHPEVFQYYGMMSAGLPPGNCLAGWKKLNHEDRKEIDVA
jgi:hypothetical protein